MQVVDSEELFFTEIKEMNLIYPHPDLIPKLAVAVLIILYEACHASAQPAADEDLRKALGAWRTRQTQIKSFDVHWSGSETRTSKAGLPGKQNKAPPKDATFPISMRFALDSGNRVRFEYEHKSWEPDRGEYIPAKTIAVFDGERRIVFSPQGYDFPDAAITKKGTAETARHVQNLPVRLAFRAFDSSLGMFDEDRLTIAQEKGIVGDSTCIILRHDENSVWLDPAKEYIPIRYYDVRNGKTIRFIEMEYSLSKDHGWVPSAWKNSWFTPKGDLKDAMRATVTKCEINQTIPDDAFRIVYPTGTMVSDYVADQRYILRDGGAKRLIRDGEYDGTNYETLRDTNAPGSLNVWIMVLIGLASAIVIVALVVSWRRSRAA